MSHVICIFSQENQIVMNYIKGKDRHQYTMFPNCIEDYVEADSPVRLFDAFVESLDMDALGFGRSKPNFEGRPSYDPRDLLRVYIYGYFYAVRSSRRLERECKCNIEVMWLINRLTPDFRTISDFRKDNKEAISKTFREFNRYCYKLHLFSKSFISIDGSKFKAVNAKDCNFTLNKLDDRIKRLDEHIILYMNQLEEADENETRSLSKEELEHKLDSCKERKQRYETYREHMEKCGASQLSLTDPEARLMKQNEGFGVCYNIQTAVDAESHLIADFEVTNNPTDHGLLTHISSKVKEEYEVDMLESVADKGYEDPADMSEALAEGIVPNVVSRSGADTVEVSYECREAEITDAQRQSSKPEDIRTCLQAGIIPDMYTGILTNAVFKDVSSFTKGDHNTDAEVLSMFPEQMREKAIKGYFVRDVQRNLVYCPAGEILRQKSLKKDGRIRYCNKLACKRCIRKCTRADFKEADFDKDILIMRATSTKYNRPGNGNPSPDRHRRIKVLKRKACYTLHLDMKKLEQRKCLSEHPFGTIKRSLNSYFFLLKGKAKVEAETALFCLSYNIRRAINMVGVPKLMAVIQ